MEYQVKAAFLYKFCGYVEWPAQAFVQIDSPISIGVIGSTALTDALSKITTGHTVNGRAIIVRKIQRGDSISGLHILFVTGSNVGRDSETLLNARGQPVLIVTEEDQLPPPDSMINFVLVNDKVRFDIALQPAEQSSLKISARLLAVARKVIPRPSS
ncbi:MAG: YfiR family protein [Pseudomonadota bacterium]